ncbi:hypothetical protein JCM19232_3510 [Vibrio ishigakensis]|uniref:Uncharacterized protein n=1 Tax=Vibrio ishigakensis TaxID=1481914 RepID=A0A0B8PNH2_9VIBR|nr:hypothetical protein JCM19232_3510 [Vibrio ishigakensis]
MSGCNDDSSNDSHSGEPNPAPEGSNIEFLIHPYLQMPQPTSMTVRFEASADSAQVWVREQGSHSAWSVVEADLIDLTISETRSATLQGLKPKTVYEYYVVSDNGSEQSVSEMYFFKTYNEKGDKSPFNIIAIGDTQNGDTQNGDTLGVLEDVINSGIIQYACENDKEQCAENLTAITIAGDIVSDGYNFEHWRDQFFEQMKNITPYVPLITVPGNHDYSKDAHLTKYKHFFETPKNGDPSYDETWYTIDINNLRMFGMDSFPISHSHSNFQRDVLKQQIHWMSNERSATESDENIDYMFSMMHHPCLSEMWITGESLGSCEIVAETENYSKATGKISGHFFGHTHAYSRGQSMDTPHLWMNSSTSQATESQCIMHITYMIFRTTTP